MQGRICLITGATSGMGQATAAALAGQGATVVLVARSASKAVHVRDEIRTQSGNPNVEYLLANLDSQQEIRQLAAAFTQRYQQLHVLVNNAGGIFSQRQLTVDGLEMTFAVDHLAYFLLTNLLLDTIKASAPARIINVSSSIAAVGSIKFDDLQRAKGYTAFGAYAQAKLANLLFSYALARRLEGSGVTVNAITPGPVATRFGANNKSGIPKLLSRMFQLFARSSEQGAQTAIYLASAPALASVSGKAFYNSKEQRTTSKAHDVAAQERLWQVSAELTKLQSAAQAA